jgi:hypothetical protein
MARFYAWRWWILVFFLAIIVWRCLPLRPLPAHTGDGEFTENTVRGRLFSVYGPSLWDFRGYFITFPGFDMTADSRAEFRVAHLPQIGPDCRLILGVNDPGCKWFARDQEQRQLRARLHLEILDARGEVIRQADGRLGEWVWGFWNGQHRLQQSSLEFSPSHDQEYTFRLTYTGDEALAGLRGYCYLECGPRP